ncbi:GDSL-type esterase/lipase family protein [Cohaesibacter gelatinilyticus]|uniref:Lysophospholipase L1 n=1 Tax=Cohaesibacter gelatinilyticus TaxID=372072 RepID=A0A285NET3_9HYPH|nr:GDSL-type esterase/lipase family protein [Cohaesibacter gelatinilyticus]SNZ07403.1 Lysophospholipase L1 [Cohaesibacter gelatinilyticus]HAT84854.1 SGNH/GDSL hydrolase family protein [Hyphomicrobiales bacterium]
MSSTNSFKLGFWALCLFSFLFSVYNEEWDLIGAKRKALYAILACLFLVSLALLMFEKMQQIAITFLLLMGLNTPLALFMKVDYITLPPNLDTKIQIVGDVLPGFSGVESITTDSKGFRTTKKIDYSDKEPFRVFAIGGSTTEQLALDDHETWTSVLQELLEQKTGRDVEVINTGVSGLTSRQHYATLEEIKNYQPDMVLFMMGINDWNKDIKALQSAIPFPELGFRNTPLRYGLENAFNIANSFRPKAPDNLTIERGDYYSKQNDSLNRPEKVDVTFKTVSERYKNWVQKISDGCKEWGLNCIFIDQPVAYQAEIEQGLRERLWMTPPNEAYTLSLNNLTDISNTYNSWLISFARNSEHLKACPISQNVPASIKYLTDDCHFNEAGAKLVGTLISDCLVSTIH